jgi:hypothetical protein
MSIRDIFEDTGGYPQDMMMQSLPALYRNENALSDLLLRG